jgi:hypothetical protein
MEQIVGIGAVLEPTPGGPLQVTRLVPGGPAQVLFHILTELIFPFLPFS